MTNIQVEDLTEIKKKVTFEIPQEKVLEMMDAEYRDCLLYTSPSPRDCS